MADNFVDKTALVVDDSHTMRRIVAETLQNCGLKTLEADHGLEALALLGQHKVDVVFTDLMMPEMDGFELCGEIRRQQAHRALSLVVMTTHCDARYVVRALRMGADDFITKPMSSEQITKILGRLSLTLPGGRRD